MSQQIDTEVIDDPSMSWKALGLYVWLCSQPDSWVFCHEDIHNASSDGATSVRTGLQELVDAGYLVWRRARRKGRYSHCEYMLFDSDGMVVKWNTGAKENGEPGYVYVLKNESVCGLKVGFTSRTAEERAHELSRSTAVPTPFTVAHEEWCENANIVEQQAHYFLDNYRIGESEFFTANLTTCVEAIYRADLAVNEVR